MMRRLPPDVLVDSAWLQGQGLSRSSIHGYVARGWLEHYAPRLYRRPTDPPQSGPMAWELAVASAQLLARKPFHVGGATAIDLMGLSHYLRMSKRVAWLYDPYRAMPSWLREIPLDAEIIVIRRKLFETDEVGLEYRPLDLVSRRVGLPVPHPTEEGLWRQFLRISAAERAAVELLAEVKTAAQFESADAIFEGLANLRPEMLRRVLSACLSVKAKRLFLFFAERHAHGWARALQHDQFDLGSGKRQVVKGGKLDSRYQITVPAGLARQSDA